MAIGTGQNLVESMMQVYQADLAKIGVKLNIKVMEAAAWIDTVNNVKYTGLYFSGDNNAHVNPGYAVEHLAGLAADAVEQLRLEE